MTELTPEILAAIIDGGASVVIVLMIWDMRREQKEMNRQIWALLDYLVRSQEALG